MARTVQVTLSVKVDGVELSNFPIVRRQELEEMVDQESVLAASASFANVVPTAMGSTAQDQLPFVFGLVDYPATDTEAKNVLVRFNDGVNNNNELIFQPGGFFLLFNCRPSVDQNDAVEMKKDDVGGDDADLRLIVGANST